MQSNKRFKFRAWDKHTNKMWQWEEHNAFTTGRGSIKQWFDDSDLIHMQYTGTADKHGVDIYEGDILYHSNEKKIIGVVVWNPASYCFSIDSPDGSEYVADLADYDYEPEIMGNIFQHKELLSNG